MSEYSAMTDDFEKVDQDELVTSTGDMAEEDRYSGTSQNEASDLVNEFAGSSSSGQEAPTSEPLINLGSPESTFSETQSPPAAEAEEKSEGCFMQTVDPRDDLITSSPFEPNLEEMDEPSPEVSAEPAEAQTETSCDMCSEVLELIYWRDVKKTGVVFGSMMFVLLSLACFSLLSVLAYLSLATLTVTFSFRVYKNVMQAVQKTNEGHPFQKLMDLDLDLKEEVVRNAAEKIANNINNCSRELRRLYLVGDYIDSLKFGLLLWLLTYIGAWFNGMTLVILAVVSIFTLPKVYETYQGPIDQNVNLVRAQLNNIMAQVSAKIPFPKKKVKAQ